MSDTLRKTLHSPLLHFMVIGGLIYAAYGWTATESYARATETVHITSGEVDWLSESFASRWNRGPMPDELQGLLDAYVRETVLYREALAMGLDQDDVIIRRRLAQKLEFLFQDLADASAPSADELREYFAANPDRYEEPEYLTFTHVFIDPDKRGDSTLDDAEAILAELQALAEAPQGSPDVGDRFMLQGYYPERPQSEIAKLFGQGFTGSIMGLAVGEWHGPVLSGYGVHLVYIHERTPARPLSFEEVGTKVLEDLQGDRRKEFNEEFYASLLRRYEIIIDEPPTSEPGLD